MFSHKLHSLRDHSKQHFIFPCNIYLIRFGSSIILNVTVNSPDSNWFYWLKFMLFWILINNSSSVCYEKKKYIEKFCEAVRLCKVDNISLLVMNL